jgi:hypothetical protein
MQNTQDTLNDLSPESEPNKPRKVWKTPELRILPVPTRTQGGGGDVDDQDDIFYRKTSS